MLDTTQHQLTYHYAAPHTSIIILEQSTRGGKIKKKQLIFLKKKITK